jgi:hypothetical protein
VKHRTTLLLPYRFIAILPCPNVLLNAGPITVAAAAAAAAAAAHKSSV